MPSKKEVSIFWMRRDLRLEDNAALCHALEGDHPVLVFFLFDTQILDELPENDARVNFIHARLGKIREELQRQGSDLLVKVGVPEKAWKEVVEEWKVRAVYFNRDIEPYAKERDKRVAHLLEKHSIPLRTSLDHLIFSGDDILNQSGEPYKVYTPFAKAWIARLHDKYGSSGGVRVPEYQAGESSVGYEQVGALSFPSLEDIGFRHSEIEIPEADLSPAALRSYGKMRDLPAKEATTRVGVHLRFGTVSIRKAVNLAVMHSEVYLKELIWREFFSMILDHYPRVVTESFREEYDRIEWRNDEGEFRRWCEGTTGFPLVDAGMRQLNQTGYMHNRVRMVVASFLTKDLLIDWRWGEQYFAEKLLDYELASNNGNWQWAAGTGTDAAPYFRIFNPESQRKKFDPEGEYVRRWLPDLDSLDYPDPMVDHKAARERCLEAYRKALNST